MGKVSRREKDTQKVRYYKDEVVQRVKYNNRQFRWRRPNGEYVDVKDTILK